MLTLKQALIVSSRRSAPPWRAREIIAPPSSKGSLSLKAAIKDIAAQKMVVFLQIRDSNVLKSVNTLDEFNTAWRSSHPGLRTLKKLSKILTKTGAFINGVSSDGQTVGIAGTVEDLVGVPVIFLGSSKNPPSPRTLSGTAHILAGTGTVVGAAIAMSGGPLTEAGYWALMLVAGTGSGVALVGVTEVAGDKSGQPMESVKSGDVTVCGSPPPGVPLQSISEDWVTDEGEIDGYVSAVVVEIWPKDGGAGAVGEGEGDGGGSSDTEEGGGPEGNQSGTSETSEPGSSETGSSETESSETGSSETESSETGSSETESSETGSSETGSSETGSSETGSSETGSSETGSSETGSSETGSSETGEGDQGPPVTETGPDKVRP
jgi:hypothetical protein